MPMLAVLLPLVVSAPAAPAPVADVPASPLDGCEATEVHRGWRYDCAGLAASCQDHPEPGGAESPFFTGMISTFARPEGARTRSEKRKLGGVEVEVFVLEVPGQPATIQAAALSEPKGTRVLSCVGEPSRCRDVLSTLAGLPWASVNAPGSVRRDPATMLLAIAGHAIPVPAGCKPQPRSGGGRVACGENDLLGWVTGPEEDVRRQRASFGPTWMQFMAQGGALGRFQVTDDEVRCRVAGTETTCGRIVAAFGSIPVLLLWATVPAREGLTLAYCSVTSRELRPPCAPVFELR